MRSRRVCLRYGALLDGAGGKHKIENISGAALAAGSLWTAADEGLTIERLERRDSDFIATASHALGDLFPGYPPEGEDEADLEGLAGEGRRLWLTGSHALARKKPDRQPTERLLGRRGKREAARTLTGYVALTAGGEPVPGSGRALPLGDAEGSLVAEMGRDWEELRRAAERPAKENGLDIEGLAAVGNRLFLGLRGPVIGGFAILLELELAEEDGALSIIRRDGISCRPHLVDTGGLGIRDLALHDKGLIMLAGPTHDAEGPFQLYMTRAPLDGWTTEPGTVRTARYLGEIAIERSPDEQGRPRGRRPEAIALLEDGLLVIAERDRRADEPGALAADLVDLAALF